MMSTAVYSKLLWAREYSNRAFISVDVREANFSMLRIMARLVDSDLSSKFKQSWQATLEDVAGRPASEALKHCKQFRQKVLGSLHEDWIESQKSVVSAHEYKQLVLQREQFAKSEMGFNKVAKNMQQAIMRHVAAMVCKHCELRIFAFLGDEVKFILPQGCSVAEVDQAAAMVYDALPHVFAGSFSDLQNIFSVSGELSLDLSPHYMDGDHGACAVLCRRVNMSTGPDLSMQLKGIRGSNRFLEPSELEKVGSGVYSLHREHLADWTAWYGRIPPAD